MTPRRHLALLLACSLAAVGPGAFARAQVPDSSYASQRIARLADHLRADVTLPDSLRYLSVHDIVDPTNASYFRLLNDSTSRAFMRVVAATLHQVPDSLCGSLLGPDAGPSLEFADMLPHLDATTIDSWAVLFEHVMHVRAAGGPGLPQATPEQVQAATVAILQRLSPEDRQRLIFVARHPPPSQRDACWSMQVLMDGLAAMSAGDLGPVVRAMFGPVTPSNPESP
jgi:hypothetical protein